MRLPGRVRRERDLPGRGAGRAPARRRPLRVRQPDYGVDGACGSSSSTTSAAPACSRRTARWSAPPGPRSRRRPPAADGGGALDGEQRVAGQIGPAGRDHHDRRAAAAGRLAQAVAVPPRREQAGPSARRRPRAPGARARARGRERRTSRSWRPAAARARRGEWAGEAQAARGTRTMRAIAIEVRRLRTASGRPSSTIRSSGPDSVLIRVRAAGINCRLQDPSRGTSPGASRTCSPVIPGWDAAGVSRAGRAWSYPLRARRRGVRLLPQGLVRDGTYAELVSVRDYAVAREAGAACRSRRPAASRSPASRRAAGFLRHAIDIKAGEALVSTRGAYGWAASWCRSPRTTTRSHRHCERPNHDYLRELGADDVIDYTSEDFVAAVRELYTRTGYGRRPRGRRGAGAQRGRLAPGPRPARVDHRAARRRQVGARRGLREAT